MKTIAITPRVIISEHGERFEALAKSWSQWLAHAGYHMLQLTLHPPAMEEQLAQGTPDAVLLSGGNDIASLPNARNTAPERDAAETQLIGWAMQHQRPIIGVCRGMQLLNLHCGGGLSPVQGHAGTRHSVRYETSGTEEEVNSYHNWGITPDDLAADMQAVAKDTQGNIEAMQHRSLPIAAIMWHPEREAVDHPSGAWIKTFLGQHL